MRLPDAPFVLLDDARPGGRARLYVDPVDMIVAYRREEVRPALARLRAETQAGRHVAGAIDYEAGLALEPRLGLLSPSVARPLLWFGVFETVALPEDVAALLPDGAGAYAGQPVPEIDQPAHARAVTEILALIAAGDIYQANLSFRCSVPIAGDPRALYARLRSAAGGGWGGIVFDGERWLLSFSPELFFRTEGDRIVARPMKGTGPSGATPAERKELAGALAADPKQRAENLMIVDLMRNDLARIAAPGSVRVPELFAVEQYPTVQQMVSGVEARLAEGRNAIDAIGALFPCGSITGAPKVRAMEAIAATEGSPRHAYTGAIGAIGPDGDAAFNVAIRTLEIEAGEIEAGASTATLGLGSAIVADSRASDEWRECLAKGAFVRADATPFDLIETLLFDPMEGLPDLEAHVARLGASAKALGFAFDRHALRNDLHAATFRCREARCVRIRLALSGASAIELRPLPAPPNDPVAVAIVPLPVDPADFRLVHKTSDRVFYDRARAATGRFEVIFSHPGGELTEGSFSSLFVVRADGLLTTPPLTLGLLPGVLRARLIEEGRAVEGAVREGDLQGDFFIGNALRGLIPARLVSVAVAAGAKATL